MIRKLSTLALSMIFLWGLGLVSTARADTLHQTVWFKTNQPLELRYRVIAPGQYQLSFIGINHQVVALSKRDGQQLGFFLVRPTQLEHRAQSQSMILSRPMPNNPDRLREWTYPGERTAYVFVYPKAPRSAVARQQAPGNPGGQ